MKLNLFETNILDLQILENQYFQNTSISKHFFSYQLNPCYNKAMQQGKGLCSGSQPDGVLVTFCGLATNFENVTTEPNNRKECMTTIALTARAASRRAILANAHAAFYAATLNHPNERTTAMEEALKLTNTIHEDTEIADITKEGTTLLITLYGTFEVLALDAYGNILKGTV